MGFFAEAGPVQIFVSSHLIPDDFDFSALDDPAYISADEEVPPPPHRLHCYRCCYRSYMSDESARSSTSICIRLQLVHGQGCIPTASVTLMRSRL